MEEAGQFLILLFVFLVIYVIKEYNKGEDDHYEPRNEKERKEFVKELSQKGAKQKSFYYHAMAWCMENGIPGKYHINERNPKKKKFLFRYDEETEVHVYLDKNDIWNIQIVAVLGVDRDNQVAEEIIDQIKGKHPDIIFDRHFSNNHDNIIKWFDIGCTMDVDAAKEDARYYIPGFIEDVLLSVREEVNAEFIKRNKDLRMNRYYYNIDI